MTTNPSSPGGLSGVVRLPLDEWDETPEAWLSQHDSRPRIVPRWPDSSRMAVVLVRSTGKGEWDSEAFLVLNPEALAASTHPKYGMMRLFFTVPRRILVEEESLGIDPNCWDAAD